MLLLAYPQMVGVPELLAQDRARAGHPSRDPATRCQVPGGGARGLPRRVLRLRLLGEAALHTPASQRSP